MIAKRTTKSLEAYQQGTHTVGALERLRAHGIERAPGETVAYVVVDDDAGKADQRVRLAFEDHEDTTRGSTRRC